MTTRNTTRTIPLPYRVSNRLIGRTVEGNRIYASVSIELREEESETVGHDHVESFVRCSFTWALVEGTRTLDHASSFGAGTDWSVDAVTKPARGFTMQQVHELAALAKEWHLNDMHAGCDHQTVVYETGPFGRRQPSLKLTAPCPHAGYRYGHSWLLKPVPVEVIEQVASIFGR
jgi:hypothetical protein